MPSSYGSSPLHPDTVARLIEQHPQIRLHQQLGQTEGSPITNLFHSDHIEALATNAGRLRSVGRPVPQSTLRIEDPDEDGIGEICSSANHYFRPDPDGWLRTGDLGRVDEGGYVYLAGRKQDVINGGGLKIHPIEVEQLIGSYPGIREVALAGVRDRRLNQVPHAFVVLDDPGASPHFDAVRAYARERLAATSCQCVGMSSPHSPATRPAKCCGECWAHRSTAASTDRRAASRQTWAHSRLGRGGIEFPVAGMPKAPGMLGFGVLAPPLAAAKTSSA